jgi:ubiquinone/menaquinone biosynthesis C-methylase UbiE
MQQTISEVGQRLESSSQHVMETIRSYWNEHIHDLKIARHPLGSREFFAEIEAYRFEKLEYLPEVIGYASYNGKRLLEVGCGIGIDLVRFAQNGAIVTGIDLAGNAIELAKRNFAFHSVRGDLRVMDGEHLHYPDNSFDVAFVHGVLHYTPNPTRMVREVRRVLKPGGEAIWMVYNRCSWLNLLAVLFAIKLEYADAPAFKKYSISEFRDVLNGFSQVEIIPERFPVKTRLHTGFKAALYNALFVGTFNFIPKPLIRPFGWHLIGKVVK